MKRKLSKKKEKIVEKFEKTYKGLIAPKTMTTYKITLKQLLLNNINISSKSKFRHFKAVFKRLQEMEITEEIENIKLPEKWSKRGDTTKKNILDKYICLEDLETIVLNVPGTSKGAELKKAILISYYSGLRLDEVIHLKKKDIDFNNHIKLRVSGKGSKTRTAYLQTDQKGLLENFLKFTISDGYVKATIQRIRKKTDINFSFHSLRHSFASNKLKAGGNIALLQKLLGHSNLATTSVYLHCIDDSEQLEKLGL